jgi:hypothetical protein
VSPRIVRLCLAAAFAIALAAPGGAQSTRRYAGLWLGTVPGATRLRLALTIEQGPRGLVGYTTNLDKGNTRAPAIVAILADTLVVVLPQTKAQFIGMLVGRDTLRGTYTQGAARRLDLIRVTALPGKRAQGSASPFTHGGRL